MLATIRTCKITAKGRIATATTMTTTTTPNQGRPATKTWNTILTFIAASLSSRAVKGEENEKNRPGPVCFIGKRGLFCKPLQGLQCIGTTSASGAMKIDGMEAQTMGEMFSCFPLTQVWAGASGLRQVPTSSNISNTLELESVCIVFLGLSPSCWPPFALTRFNLQARCHCWGSLGGKHASPQMRPFCCWSAALTNIATKAFNFTLKAFEALKTLKYSWKWDVPKPSMSFSQTMLAWILSRLQLSSLAWSNRSIYSHSLTREEPKRHKLVDGQAHVFSMFAIPFLCSNIPALVATITFQWINSTLEGP